MSNSILNTIQATMLEIEQEKVTQQQQTQDKTAKRQAFEAAAEKVSKEIVSALKEMNPFLKEEYQYTQNHYYLYHPEAMDDNDVAPHVNLWPQDKNGVNVYFSAKGDSFTLSEGYDKLKTVNTLDGLKKAFAAYCTRKEQVDTERVQSAQKKSTPGNNL